MKYILVHHKFVGDSIDQALLVETHVISVRGLSFGLLSGNSSFSVNLDAIFCWRLFMISGKGLVAQRLYTNC